MTKSDLIHRLYLNSNLTQEDIGAAVNLILEKMTEQLANGGRIEIRGFGAFSLNHHKARTGRNPKTGDTIMIPEKYTTHFKPGKSLRERVNDSRPT